MPDQDLTIKKIITEFREMQESFDGDQVSKYRMYLSGEFAYHSSRMAEYEELKADWWEANRQLHKSDASTNRAWDLMPAGRKAIRLARLLKSLEKLISSLRTRIDYLISEKRLSSYN